MSPAEIVRRAVALIGPDERRRTECVNAVKVALSVFYRQDKTLRRQHRHKKKPTQEAADRLKKALQDLERAFRDPNLSDELYAILPDGEPRRLIERFDAANAAGNAAANAVREKTGKKRRERLFDYRARKKEAAATEAHHLLRQFGKKISATKGSAFCQLTALLYGEPKANLQWTCRRLLNSKD